MSASRQIKIETRIGITRPVACPLFGAPRFACLSLATTGIPKILNSASPVLKNPHGPVAQLDRAAVS